MVHFDFVAGRQKPENMKRRRSLPLILILAACFYGNGAQRTGGCDYVAVTLLHSLQHITLTRLHVHVNTHTEQMFDTNTQTSVCPEL